MRVDHQHVPVHSSLGTAGGECWVVRGLGCVRILVHGRCSGRVCAGRAKAADTVPLFSFVVVVAGRSVAFPFVVVAGWSVASQLLLLLAGV